MFKSFRKRSRSHEFKGQSSLSRWLNAPFQYFWNLVGGDVDELGNKAPLQKRLWRLLIQILYFPFFCLWQVIQFIVLSWTTTRSMPAFILGALPLLVAGGLIAIVVASNYTEDRLARSRHRQYTVDHEAVDEYEEALLGSKRVQQISSEPQWRYIHAFTLMKAEQPENAQLILEELAPLEQPGHIRAHLYLALQLMEEFAADPENDQLLVDAETHLNHVLEVEPENAQAILWRAKVWLVQGNTDQAMIVFRELSGIFPEIVPELASYLMEKGEIEEADFHMTRGLDKLRRQAEENPNEPAIWDNMFKILMVNDNYQKAMNELTAAFALVEDPAVQSRLRLLQSNVHLEFARKFDQTESQDTYRRRLMAISRAISHYPRNGPALDIFIDMVLYPENEQTESWLDEESRDNLSPPIYHLIHGLRDGIKGKPVTSKKHFNLALDGDARTAIIINDISWMVSMTKERPDDGLKLINVAIDTWPGSKLFQTRGEILMKQGRHAEALEELEYAAEEIDNDPRVFEVLGDCYEALGETEKAAASRQRGQEKLIELKSRIAQSNKS